MSSSLQQNQPHKSCGGNASNTWVKYSKADLLAFRRKGKGSGSLQGTGPPPSKPAGSSGRP
eukprot:3415436-Amphidinium_carterae.1